jgi:hypothetical protein
MENSIGKRTIVLGALLGLVGLAVPEDANAAIRRVHSSSCHATYDNLGTTFFNGEYISNSGPALTPVNVYCDAESDSELPHSTASYLRVDGAQAANGTNSSRACVKSYSGTSFYCGASKLWSASGASNVDLSSWQAYSTYYPYVHSAIKGGTQLFGFYYY